MSMCHDDIIANLHDVLQVLPNMTFEADTGMYMLTCGCKDSCINKLPDLEFMMAGKRFSLGPESYLVQVSQAAHTIPYMPCGPWRACIWQCSSCPSLHQLGQLSVTFRLLLSTGHELGQSPVVVGAHAERSGLPADEVFLQAHVPDMRLSFHSEYMPPASKDNMVMDARFLACCKNSIAISLCRWAQTHVRRPFCLGAPVPTLCWAETSYDDTSLYFDGTRLQEQAQLGLRTPLWREALQHKPMEVQLV